MLIGYFNKYRGYIGTIEYDVVEKTHYGEVLDVNKRASLCYQANNIIELEKIFHTRVNDYIEFCMRNNLELN